jgi:hypothetical protein
LKDALNLGSGKAAISVRKNTASGLKVRWIEEANAFHARRT